MHDAHTQYTAPTSYLRTDLPISHSPFLPPLPLFPSSSYHVCPGAPVPGERNPILTDTQQEALDALTGGAGKSLPPAPVLPLQYSSTAGMPTQIASATTRLDEALHDEEEKKARLNQLRQTNVATAEDIQKAENALAQSEQRRQQAERSLQDAKTNQVEQMIISSDLAEISFEKVVSFCRKSREHVSRSYKRYMNRTFSQYLNQIKLEQAARLLVNSNISIIEIAYKTGFNNLNYFYRLFREKYMLSPSRYRKKFSNHLINI